MHQIPTIDDIEALGTDIARHGFIANESSVAHLAEAARHIGSANRTAVDVLADVSEPEAARARAFAKLARRWHHDLAVHGSRQLLDEALDDVLLAWKRTRGSATTER